MVRLAGSIAFSVLLLAAVPVRAETASAAGDPGAGETDPEPAPGPEPSPEPSPEPAPPQAKLRGRVFERGTISPLPGITVQSEAGETAVTDAEGRFELALPAGKTLLLLSGERHEPLRVTEALEAGRGLAVEYRLMPLPAYRRKYESVVRGEARHEGERFSLRGEELTQAPGSLGDPFRTIGLMPGVATPLPLLPVYVIRGASPGTNGFFLDGMRVPQLFHFLVGGGVVHPRLVDRLDFFPGAYDVSFGRYAGGVIDAETRPARKTGYHGELELRLYDISAMVELALPKGVRVAAAGHYGYPGFIIHAIEPSVNVSYWDYQLRLDWQGLTVEALGSFDSLTLQREKREMGMPVKVDDQLRLSFHRLQVRHRQKWRRADLEAALVGGVDEMATFGGAGVRKLSLGWRVNTRARLWRLRILAGTDGELSRFRAENFSPDVPAMQPDQLGDLSGTRDGVVAGAFLEGTLEVIPRRLFATAGVRADVYHSGSVTLVGVDPRFALRARLLPQLSIIAGIGLYQQPPSFPVALPGIDTFALQLGLQRAWQGAVKVEAQLPQKVTVGLTGYYQKYANVNDVVFDFGAAVCTSPPPESLSGIPARITRQVNGHSYGMELLLRKQAGRFTGWIAYTLSRSERIFSCGLRPADYDQTHTLNVVAQVRLPWRLMVGARLYVASGRPVTLLDPETGLSTLRNNTRLPNYVQLDLRLDREWLFRKWALAVFLEIVNITYSQSIFGVYYPEEDGVTRYDQPTLNAFRWILPSIGFRGRF